MTSPLCHVNLQVIEQHRVKYVSLQPFDYIHHLLITNHNYISTLSTWFILYTKMAQITSSILTTSYARLATNNVLLIEWAWETTNSVFGFYDHIEVILTKPDKKWLAQDNKKKRLLLLLWLLFCIHKMKPCPLVICRFFMLCKKYFTLSKPAIIWSKIQ